MEAYLLLAVLAVILFYPIYVYNNVIKKRNATENAFGSIDAMLKKRYDLIPNLVETVRQYMVHESNVLTEITRLRSRLSENIPNEERVDVHNQISKQFSELILSVENYPNLKANQNFMALQASWNEIEEQISASRRYYNTAITEYNNAIQTFPANIIFNSNRFPVKKVFEINETERQNISAKELFKS